MGLHSEYNKEKRGAIAEGQSRGRRGKITKRKTSQLEGFWLNPLEELSLAAPGKKMSSVEIRNLSGFQG